MSRSYPALDVIWPVRPDDERIGILIAEASDESPTAVEERPDRLRFFFHSALARGRAAVRLVALEPDLICEPVEVPDEAWAERSQAALGAVRVERFVVAPPWEAERAKRRFSEPDILFITIQPSTGFGTAHHASTRLCLRLLQQLTATGGVVLDVGTGSGVLAIAAARLGAARVRAIDHDPDAIASARENVALNGTQEIVAVEQAEFEALEPGQRGFDLVLANLTGATLIRHAPTLAACLAAPGSVIVGGFGTEETEEVMEAFAATGLMPAGRADEEGWAAARFTSPTPSRARSRPRSAPRPRGAAGGRG